MTDISCIIRAWSYSVYFLWIIRKRWAAYWLSGFCSVSLWSWVQKRSSIAAWSLHVILVSAWVFAFLPQSKAMHAPQSWLSISLCFYSASDWPQKQSWALKLSFKQSSEWTGIVQAGTVIAWAQFFTTTFACVSAITRGSMHGCQPASHPLTPCLHISSS